MKIRHAATLALSVFGIVLTSCSQTHGALPIVPPAGLVGLVPDSGTGYKKIFHVVIIYQENRSFDNLFQGYPGADTVPSGKNSKGQTIKLQPVSLARQYDIDHSMTAMIAACRGTGKLPGTQCRMDGFDKESSFNGPKNPEYVYVPHNESKPYFDMAHEWVLADHKFQSHLDESFVAHQYIIAAQAHSSVDLPYGGYWGCDGGPSDQVQTVTAERKYGSMERPCFEYKTLGDELDDAGLTWRFYTSTINNDGGEWSGYQAVRHIRYGPDWKYVVTPQTQFFTDIAAGKLANVTWITPTCVNSDHVNCGGGYGPSWVTTLVNAVGKSKFWDHTAIFVAWDDWGGLYDHVPPPYEDSDGLGFRSPLLVISPFAKKNYVSHVQYETSSILKFAEDVFRLGRLAASDTRASNPAYDCFDFARAPRTFVPINAPNGLDFFMHQSYDTRPPDYE